LESLAQDRRLADGLARRRRVLGAPENGTEGKGADAKLPPQVHELLDRLDDRCALPQELITQSRPLDITATARTAQRYNANTGEGRLVFEDTYSGGQKVMVPKLFLIAITLFNKSPFHYLIPVRIRYRLHRGIKRTFAMFGAGLTCLTPAAPRGPSGTYSPPSHADILLEQTN
jgi:hypothetical protein